jgi:hypothetical protein
MPRILILYLPKCNGHSFPQYMNTSRKKLPPRNIRAPWFLLGTHAGNLYFCFRKACISKTVAREVIYSDKYDVFSSLLLLLSPSRILYLHLYCRTGIVKPVQLPGCELYDRRFVPSRDRNLSLRHRVQLSSWDHPANCPVGGCFPRSKSGLEVDHSSPSHDKVKNAQNYIFTRTYSIHALQSWMELDNLLDELSRSPRFSCKLTTCSGHTGPSSGVHHFRKFLYGTIILLWRKSIGR